MTSPNLMTLELEGSARLRGKPNDRRIDILMVPWDTSITLMGRNESFAPGSAVPNGNIPLRYTHRTDQPPIGQLESWRHTEIGLEGTFVLLDSPAASDALAAVATVPPLVSGASIEFTMPGRTQGNPREGSGRVTQANVTGCALTETPAFPTAGVLSVRDSWLTPTKTVERPRYDETVEWFNTITKAK